MVARKLDVNGGAGRINKVSIADARPACLE
jgi:hypothetical protein